MGGNEQERDRLRFPFGCVVQQMLHGSPVRFPLQKHLGSSAFHCQAITFLAQTSSQLCSCNVVPPDLARTQLGITRFVIVVGCVVVVRNSRHAQEADYADAINQSLAKFVGVTLTGDERKCVMEELYPGSTQTDERELDWNFSQMNVED